MWIKPFWKNKNSIVIENNNGTRREKTIAENGICDKQYFWRISNSNNFLEMLLNSFKLPQLDHMVLFTDE